MNSPIFIFKLIGNYIGFIDNNKDIFSRDGIYLGWLEDNNVWGINGEYRGKLMKIGDSYYILRNLYVLPPTPKSPQVTPTVAPIPSPPPNVAGIVPPAPGMRDAFQ